MRLATRAVSSDVKLRLSNKTDRQGPPNAISHAMDGIATNASSFIARIMDFFISGVFPAAEWRDISGATAVTKLLATSAVKASIILVARRKAESAPGPREVASAFCNVS